MAEKHNERQSMETGEDKNTQSGHEDASVEFDGSSVKVEIERDDDVSPQESVEQPTEVEVLRGRVAELEDKLLRTAAEFENRKKRLDRQADEMIRTANDRLIGQLLDVIDNFQRALDHGDENKESFRQGIELIYNQLIDMLSRYEITPIESVGHRFDPSVHEALMQVESDKYDEGVVALEISPGYKAGDRVLRYAKVGVSKGRPAKNDNRGKAPEENDEDN